MVLTANKVVSSSPCSVNSDIKLSSTMSSSSLLFSTSSIGNSIAGVVFTEPVSVFFLSCAYLFSLIKFRQKYYLVGFAVGLSGLFRHTPILFAIIMGFKILLIEKRQRIRSLTKYVLGGVIGFSPLLIYIIHQNVFGVFFKAIYLIPPIPSDGC